MIFDCFIFYDEFMLLELRLLELWDVVDKFVLVESPNTFSGKAKPLYFHQNKDSFKQYSEKIVPLVFDQTIPYDDRRTNEIAQRMAIGDYLKTVCSADDIVIVSDADEIPSREAIEIVGRLSVPGRLKMRHYYYYFNCRQNHDWMWPAFCRYGDFVDIFNGSAQSLRVSGETPILVMNGGWHFAYLMEPERIVEKLGDFCHTEFDIPKYKNIKHIDNCRSSMIDLFERPGYSYSIDPMKNLPKTVRDNKMDVYTEFLRLNGEKNKPLMRSDVINDLIKEHHLSRYLEIGIDNPAMNFDKIMCDYKAGVDPNVDCKYRMTSDDFFRSFRGEKFDLIFVDGLHTAEQALKDINNAINLITEDGFVVVHDCNPASEKMQWPIERLVGRATLPYPGWCGDVWKAWAKLRISRPDLGMYVVDVDYGVGVINKSSQQLFTKKIIQSYSFLDENRQELLNLREPCRI